MVYGFTGRFHSPFLSCVAGDDGWAGSNPGLNIACDRAGISSSSANGMGYIPSSSALRPPRQVGG